MNNIFGRQKYSTIFKEGDVWIVYYGFSPNVCPHEYIIAQIHDSFIEAVDAIIRGSSIYIIS
jgi:hypothetical protein